MHKVAVIRARQVSPLHCDTWGCRHKFPRNLRAIRLVCIIFAHTSQTMNSRSNNRKDSPANGILQTPSERSTAVTTDDLAEAWTDEWGVKYSPDHKRLLHAPWDFDGHYECPEGTETIGNEAFKRCTRLVSVSLPDSVTHIGEGAFAFCRALTHIRLSDALTHIGNKAFLCCNTLYGIKFPASLTHIESHSFTCCSALTYIDIPDRLTSIDSYAFAGCKALRNLNIPASLTHIGNKAFNGCTGLSDIAIAPDHPCYHLDGKTLRVLKTGQVICTLR